MKWFKVDHPQVAIQAEDLHLVEDLHQVAILAWEVVHRQVDILAWAEVLHQLMKWFKVDHPQVVIQVEDLHLVEDLHQVAILAWEVDLRQAAK